MAGSDRKLRYGGLLENPYISQIQRDILDYGRWQGLVSIIKALKPANILDVGCGLGENSRACAFGYVGIDNSAPRIFHAGRKYAAANFILGNGVSLPVKPRTFDLVMLLDTSHHLTDAEFSSVLAGMAAASRRWILVSDPVLHRGQSRISRFFYKLDRGGEFRNVEHMKMLLGDCPALMLEAIHYFTTFPGIYRRGAFLLKLR
jgi:SAM-dependent methyltransferase